MNVELIPYEKFRKLRLSQFDSSPDASDEVSGFEYMGGYWNCAQAVGVEFLRPEDGRAGLAAVCVDFQDVSPVLAACILNTLALPLTSGMSLVEVSALLGSPTETHSTGARFSNYHFECSRADPYLVICYFQDRRLRAVSVFRRDMLPKDEDVVG